MTDADVDIGLGPTLAARSQQRAGAWGLFVILCFFTLTTFDGGNVAPRIISAVFLVAAAAYFVWPPAQLKFRIGLTSGCLLGMTCWGVLQTLFFPQKIWVNGWSGVLFWFTAAMIALVAASVFDRPRPAAGFRLAFIYFASAVCVLDLLEQATRASKYFWLVPSRYKVVFGTFAYWNNFAQFVELSFPITLWSGLSHNRPRVVFLILGAIQVCAVIASGSRAGTALVVAEMIFVVGACYLRNRSRTFLFGATASLLLTGLFVYAAGFSTVLSKFQDSDQLAVRRNINASSLAMLAEHPFAGWGLDTYVEVYRKFALYDDGTYVNRAHNDWLQFAVEGGLPFECMFAAILIWAIRPAIRSGWGIGLAAVALHAFVDYPFARFGVCGWYFALASMVARHYSTPTLERNLPVR